MRKTFFKILISLFILSLFAIPQSYIFAEEIPSPVIISVSPSTIYIGDQVEIIGQNFGDTPDNSAKIILIPQYGNPNPKVISWSNTKIIIQLDEKSVPSYAYVSALKVFDDGQNISTYKRSPYSNEFPVKIIRALCRENTWSCDNYWTSCFSDGMQTRTCRKSYDCENSDIPSPPTSQNCTYTPPICTYWTYSNWSACSETKQQTRIVVSSSPNGCVGGNSILSQFCTYTPSYDVDTWTCGDWNSCSLSGVQNRSCRMTFDCPSIVTLPPVTDQYCEPPNKTTPQTPPSGTDEILNQDSIIKSSVKLLCPVDAQRASQGSGTVIDPSGIILTNKHVIAGTLGCLVGFINNFNDEPYFGERQIADIFKVSSGQDIAILKIRNPQNKRLASIDITKRNSNFRLGTEITIYGYPAKFGTNITYTSGDFSGIDGSYLKTTAILEYGNSGGGAYLKDGTFIGIPSAVVKGELNALGYILSINTINSWLDNTSIISSGTGNNNYSRVSILEDIDLNKLGSLKLFIPNTDAKGDLSAPTANQNTQNVKEQPQPNQTQGESTVIEPAGQNQQTNLEQNQTSPEKEQKPKTPWLKNFFQKIFQWITNLF